MNVIYGIGKARKRFKNAVLAIGVFDGVHRGHQALIRRALRRAREIHGEPVVMTFWPHPVHVLHPEINLSYLVSLSYRLKLIADLGVKTCIVIPFTKRFSRLSPEKFIQRYILEHIGPREIFVGDDFRFGERRQGTLEYFREAGKRYGFRVKVVSAVKTGRRKIGSSRVRKLIAAGELTAAAGLLGRRVCVMGKVVHGDGRGKKFGFPTANVPVQNNALPPVGVYAVKVHVGKEIFGGMANIGRRPSFKKGDRVHLETHLFDFRRNLYGQEIVIEFIRRIRAEKKFDSPAQFTAQLCRDQVRARRILSK